MFDYAHNICFELQILGMMYRLILSLNAVVYLTFFSNQLADLQLKRINILSIPIYQGWQTFAVNGQIVYILGFVGNMVSLHLSAAVVT